MNAPLDIEAPARTRSKRRRGLAERVLEGGLFASRWLIAPVVTFSGYGNFVSKIDTNGNENPPPWMGRQGRARVGA